MMRSKVRFFLAAPFSEFYLISVMVSVVLSDGNVKTFESGVSAIDVARAIAVSLAKDSIAVEIDGVQCDMSHIIDKDCSVRFITTKTEDALEIIRHDAAHILAQAVKVLYPTAQITIGPSIENGFYYDISYERSFTPEDLETIEAKMREISAANYPFVREIWSRNDAVSYFKSIGEHYKAEIIESIPESEDVSLYRQGDFIDLCRGPHAPSTGYTKHYKLMKIAGAYWRGDSKNEMLQRIYGTAWRTKEELDAYLFMLEEAARRDHRKIGKELGLFHIQDEAQGMVFWHDKGWRIYRVIEDYIRSKLSQHGYIEVKTPMLLSKSLWEASGHAEKFSDAMFVLESEKREYALKPMNCPCHVQIFNFGIKSYRDLPLRMAEFGSCHRYEHSGALHGLMRVRAFVQDDAHIFCTEDQITEETIAFCKLLTDVYRDFGFDEIKVRFSDRPDTRAGSDEVWDKAEKALVEAAAAAGYDNCILNPGEGAFYGPKLEFVLRDAVGREWQCGTLQVDFVLPERLGAHYVNEHGERVHPVMLHRAIIGTFERFMGILIENYAGKFPVWLAPVQVAVVTVTNEFDDYAQKIAKEFSDAKIRVELDTSHEKINAKIRRLSLEKVPLIAVVGKNEQLAHTVSLRRLGSDETVVCGVDDVVRMVRDSLPSVLRDK